MSFVNLSTIAVHKRQEMEERIRMFETKCDNTIKNVEYLKKQAQGLITHLNCNPLDLKDNFLNCIKTLEEYSYLINDINIAIEDLSNKPRPPIDKQPPSISPFNVPETLLESIPSTSKICLQPEDQSKSSQRKIQALISFSTESLEKTSTVMEPIQPVIDGVQSICFEDDDLPDRVALPAQTVLQMDYEYPAVILHVDGTSFWVTTENINRAFQFMADMTDYYKHNKVQFSIDQIKPLSCCAVYEDSGSYTRGLFIQLSEEDIRYAQVYLVDTGETVLVPTCSLQPLVHQFCVLSPLARYCHLTGVDIDYENVAMVQKFEDIVKKFLGMDCTIYVDDNTSESLGVYLFLKDGRKLNDIILKAIHSDKTDNNLRSESPKGFPGLTEENCDITQIPEYEDPVIAVTGYHNRDEADICKHYKGGPEKTCFKGKRCTKRHVVKHPDGWTLDRVSVPAKLKSLPMPAVGNFIRVLVTHVPHFDRFYVQTMDDTENAFNGLPAMTLTSLVREMNRAATVSAYKPLKMMPAPGELVASLYPMDGKWYRAMVLTSSKADQKVEIKYVDYGNLVWVEEEFLRELEPRFCILPIQATLCHLAGITIRNQSAANLNAGKNALTSLVQDKLFDAIVVATDYDTITVELYNDKGDSITDLLASQKVVERQEYTLNGDLPDGQRYIHVP